MRKEGRREPKVGDVAGEHQICGAMSPYYTCAVLKYTGVVFSTEPPVVKVTRRTQYNGLETLICRVYGFYPKEMDATWRKGGEVWEQDTFRGGVLPNSDGTYHAWLSIEVDPKERDRYRCYVDHAGFPEPLIVAWEEPGERRGRAPMEYEQSCS